MGPTELALEAAAMITASGRGIVGRIADLSESQKRRIASDITAAMQTIYRIAPTIYKRSRGATFAAPVTAALTTTDGSDTVTTAYSFGDGCSVFVGGVMNEIRTEDGAKKLRTPFSGTSGVQQAVFYSDCIALDATVSAVISPVYLADCGRQLEKVNNHAEALRFQQRSGRPTRYWVQPFLKGAIDSQVSQLLLRIMPIPSERVEISYDVRVRAPKFTAADLGSDDTPSTKSLIVADDYHELIVRPIFMQLWAGSAWMRPDAGTRQRIAEDDKAARAYLRDFQAQQARSFTITAI